MAVVGYPIGGETISVTTGVVSRIEVTSYSHGATELLGIQIDAAINPGNSGAQSSQAAKGTPVLYAESACIYTLIGVCTFISRVTLVVASYSGGLPPLARRQLEGLCRGTLLQRDRPVRGHCFSVPGPWRGRWHRLCHSHASHQPLPHRLQVRPSFGTRQLHA